MHTHKFTAFRPSIFLFNNRIGTARIGRAEGRAKNCIGLVPWNQGYLGIAPESCGRHVVPDKASVVLLASCIKQGQARVVFSLVALWAYQAPTRPLGHLSEIRCVAICNEEYPSLVISWINSKIGSSVGLFNLWNNIKAAEEHLK